MLRCVVLCESVAVVAGPDVQPTPPGWCGWRHAPPGPPASPSMPAQRIRASKLDEVSGNVVILHNSNRA